MSYLCYLCLFAWSGVKHVLTTWVTRRVSCKSQKLLTLRKHLGSSPMCGGVRLAHLFSFLCCFCFVCPRPVSYVPNVANVSGLSILYLLFDVLKRLFIYYYLNVKQHILNHSVSAYRIRCNKKRFYRKWIRCYGRYHSRSSCFGRLYKKHLFSTYTSTSTVVNNTLRYIIYNVVFTCSVLNILRE